MDALNTQGDVAAYMNARLAGSDGFYDWSDQMYITVTGDTQTTSNNGKIANRESGAPIAGARAAGNAQTATTPYAIQNSVVAGRAKGVLGVIWVDSVPDDGTCETTTSTPSSQLPEIKGVVIRNNVFNGTETAGVRAGSMKTLVVTDAAMRCRVQLDIIGNSFSNIGGTGGFVKTQDVGTNLPDVTDGNGNKIAEPGNIAPAISVALPAGTSDAKTRILSNTIKRRAWGRDRAALDSDGPESRHQEQPAGRHSS